MLVHKLKSFKHLNLHGLIRKGKKKKVRKGMEKNQNGAQEIEVEKSDAFWDNGSLLFGSLLPVILEGYAWASIKGEIMRRLGMI